MQTLMVHILELFFLTFFNNHPFNQLIENGNLYLAQPPLFKITKNNKSYYMKDEKDLEKFIIQNSGTKEKIKN